MNQAEIQSTADDIAQLLHDGCPTCVVAALITSLTDAEASATDKKISRLTAADTGASDKSVLWKNKKVLTVGFRQPKDRKTPAEQAESVVIPKADFEYLATKMFAIMQQWTKEGSGQGVGADIQLRRADKWPVVATPIPDITVEIRDRYLDGKGMTKTTPAREIPPRKQQWHSMLGAASVNTVPSITMDFGELRQATWDGATKKDVATQEFFANQILHEFGHALGFIHEHFQKTFQDKFFKGAKVDKQTRNAIIARLKQNSVFRESTPEFFESEVFDMPKDGQGLARPPSILKAWTITTDPVNGFDKDSVMMYPFGYIDDKITGKPVDTILADKEKGVVGLEVKRFTKLSPLDLRGAALAYYDASTRQWAKPKP